MLKSLASVALLLSPAAVSAASTPTDFGVRTVAGERLPNVESSATAGVTSTTKSRARRSAIDLSAVAGLGSKWGTVTSTVRTPAHNRRVGGVRNSFHLSGRAVDIARRPGVTHAQIAAAYRRAGYHLIESLDEGDHSHFAFGTAPARVRQAVAPKRSEYTAFRIVTVASTTYR